MCWDLSLVNDVVVPDTNAVLFCLIDGRPMVDQPRLDQPQGPGGQAPHLRGAGHGLPPHQVRVRQGHQCLDPASAAGGPAVEGGVAGVGGDVLLVLDTGPAQAGHATPQTLARQHRPLGHTLTDRSIDVRGPVARVTGRLRSKHARWLLVRREDFKASANRNIFHRK